MPKYLVIRFALLIANLGKIISNSIPDRRDNIAKVLIYKRHSVRSCRSLVGSVSA